MSVILHLRPNPTLDAFPMEDVRDARIKLGKNGSASVEVETFSGDSAAFISGTAGAISFLRRLLAHMDGRDVDITV